MVDEEVLSRNRKLSRIEVKKYFQALVDENISIYPHMTLEDEYKLVNSSNSFKPDIEKETTIAKELFSYFENVRDDIDFGLVANLTKILAITAESKAELHEGAYDKTIDKIIDMILDLIFKERDKNI